MKILEKQLEDLLGSNWEIEDNKLFKEFTFKAYNENIDFVNAVFMLAQNQNHHPVISIDYHFVKIWIYSHDEKNISNKCYELAKAIDFIKISPSI
jgi:4a-hydroxytetrahydrobiopterin dehydratase